LHYFNEKGNTLVLILALISVFSILYISIVGVSITNSKQITITEDNSQAVALAEMGITYYKTALYNKSTEVKANTTFKDAVNQAITKEISNTYGKITASNKASTETEINKTAYFSKLSAIASNQYMAKINTELEATNRTFFQSITVPVDTTSSNSFMISNVKQSSNQDGITYTFDSKGINGNKEITLSSVFTIPIKLDPIVLEAEASSGTGDGTTEGNTGSSDNQSIAQTGLTGNDIIDPGTLTSCVSPIPDNYRFSSNCQYNGNTTISKNTDIINAILKTNGALTIASNINQFANSTIYTTNDLTVTGNMNGISTINIHVGGDAKFNNLNSNVNNSIIEIAKNGNFENISTNNSSLYVGGNVTFQNGNSFLNTKLEVKGNYFSKNWNNTSDSIISIGGTAEIDNINSSFRNTVLSIKGTTTINNINNPGDNSIISILGNASISVINNPSKTAIYIGGDGTIKDINMGNDSKICVRGTLDITGHFNQNGNGKVYASKLTANTARNHGSKIDTNANNFTANCNSGFPDGNGGGSQTPETVYIPSIANDLRVEDSKISVDYHY
jgi:hypothetical protein